MKKFIAAIFAAALSVHALSYASPDTMHAPDIVEVSGHVLYFAGWNMLLLDSGNEVYRVSIRNQGHPALAPGDAVTAAGVLACPDGHMSIEAAKYTKLDAPPSLKPSTDVSASDFKRLFDEGSIGYGSRIRLKARLEKATKQSWGFWDIEMLVDGYTVVAPIPRTLPEDILDVAGLNPIIEVDGVMTFRGKTPEQGRLLLNVQNPSDVRLVPDDELRRKQRMRELKKLWILLPIAVYALTLAFAVVLLVKFIAARKERLRLAAVVEERKRMAADLHDTIEQHLAGAAMFLDSVLPIDGSPTPAELAPVETARTILMTAKREIRKTVWNLRVSELVNQRPADVMRSLAVRAAESGTARIHALFRGLPEHLPQNVFSDMVFIVQEAIANAMKHGKAQNISIVSDPSDNGGFVIRVANDGARFDVKKALIPESAHFGLNGMRERAKRSGMKIQFTSDDNRTIVALEVSQ